MYEARRRKVFLSYHHDDQDWKDRFVELYRDDIIDKSVEDGDINNANLLVETTRQQIREDYMSQATVTVVLIGPCTWQRKHVDWEIGSSLRDTTQNPRCGLMGILLPNHHDAGKGTCHPRRVPPRLADYARGDDPYCKIYNWTTDSLAMRRWIHEAFTRRKGNPPDNSRVQFKDNRKGDCVVGWPDQIAPPAVRRPSLRVY